MFAFAFPSSYSFSLLRLFTDCFLKLFFSGIGNMVNIGLLRHCFHKIYDQLFCNGPFSHYSYDNNAVKESQMETKTI